MQRKGSWHSEADLGETPNAQRLAKSNPCRAEGLLQRKNKFARQYSTTPDSKQNLKISTSQCLPDSLSSALRGPDSFFTSEERIGEERRRQRRGAVPPPLDLTPCVPHRYYSRTLYRLPGSFVPASVPCKPVSRPLAASLLLTGCCGSLGDGVVGGPLR